MALELHEARKHGCVKPLALKRREALLRLNAQADAQQLFVHVAAVVRGGLGLDRGQVRIRFRVRTAARAVPAAACRVSLGSGGGVRSACLAALEPAAPASRLGAARRGRRGVRVVGRGRQRGAVLHGHPAAKAVRAALANFGRVRRPKGAEPLGECREGGADERGAQRVPLEGGLSERDSPPHSPAVELQRHVAQQHSGGLDFGPALLEGGRAARCTAGRLHRQRHRGVRVARGEAREREGGEAAREEGEMRAPKDERRRAAAQQLSPARVQGRVVGHPGQHVRDEHQQELIRGRVVLHRALEDGQLLARHRGLAAAVA